MSRIQHNRLLILGSGPAGYSASVYAARANLNPVIVTGIEPGGQLNTTTDIDNWPGDWKGVQGHDLMYRMKKHAERFNVSIIYDHINEAHLQSKPFLLKGDSGIYSCDALIIATGASAKYLGLSSEETFKGKGVSTCVTCDGFFYKDQDVAVIGGGNTAVEGALYLSKIASKVTLVHRRATLRSEAILIDQIINQQENNGGNIEIQWNNILHEILGNEQGVTGICIKNLITQRIKKINLMGVFIAIGHTPNTNLFINQLKMDGAYLVTTGAQSGNVTETSIEGVFAAGDVMDHVYRQAITSAGTGCMAALDACKYLENTKKETKIKKKRFNEYTSLTVL